MPNPKWLYFIAGTTSGIKYAIALITTPMIATKIREYLTVNLNKSLSFPANPTAAQAIAML